LALESVNNIKRSNGLTLGMLGVGDGITDDTSEEGFEDAAGFLVNRGRYTLDTTAASKTADRGLCYTTNGIAGGFKVTSGTMLSKTFATFAMSVVGNRFG
jgi:hypothetical protein